MSQQMFTFKRVSALKSMNRMFLTAADRDDAAAGESRTAVRSGLLRCVVALVLVMTSWVGENYDSAVHSKVVAIYCVVTLISLLFAWLRRSPQWLSTALIVIDAILILTLFHEHVLASAPREHDLTATNIAIGFLLLVHVAMSLRPGAVILFSAILLAGWLCFTAISLPFSGSSLPVAERLASLSLDGVLAFVFVFATIMLLILIRDHNRSLTRSVAAERQRNNLQRFFAPEMAVEISRKGLALGLTEREACVMFVDLRAFTSFAELAEANELAGILRDFRVIVSNCVFEHGGTIDKFIGDAVLAVFGVPQNLPNDQANALACAQVVSQRLADWNRRSLAAGQTALQSGVGLHFGKVMFGVIESGRHAELTVLGDVVNIAQRLEQATKTLNALVVVSDAFSSVIISERADVGWLRHQGLQLPGRTQAMDVFILPQI